MSNWKGRKRLKNVAIKFDWSENVSGNGVE
jgi:hypothetical protein